MSKEIQLTRGKVALVDDEDFARLSEYHWYFDVHGYARCSTPRKIYMHRLIMNEPDGEQVDHKNQNKLDNRKENLRTCTRSQNASNTFRAHKNHSGFKGVSWDTARSKWKVQIKVNGKNQYQRRCETKEEAALIYNELAVKYFGEFAQLNAVSAAPNK